MKDYYQTLGISRQADIQEIKAAFKKLALQYHPDRNAGSRAAEEKFKQINEAYQVLSDVNNKWLYDLKLDGYYTSSETTQQTTYTHTYTQQEYSRPYSQPAYRYNPGAARKAYLAGTLIMLVLAVLGYFLYSFMNHRNARTRYAEALYYIDRNQTYNAFTKLEEAIEFDDEYAEAYLKRGQLWLKLDPGSIHAYEDFDNAIRYSKLPVPEMYLFRAMSLFKMGQYQRAIIDCAQITQEETLKGPAVFLQAAAKKAMQDHQGACQDWQLALELGFASSIDSLRVHCR